MISDAEIDKVLHFLVEQADEMAQASADRAYMDEYTGVLKAQLMKRNFDMPVSAQMREAMADPEYEKHLHALHEAIRKERRFHFLREAASAKLEAWRTLNANARIGAKV